MDSDAFLLLFVGLAALLFAVNLTDRLVDGQIG